MNTEKILFHETLYLGEGMTDAEASQLKSDLTSAPLKANVYVITISANEQDQLDIYHSKYLIQKYYKEHPPYIVGITRKQSEAYSLVEQMMQECVTARGDANVRMYLIGE